MQFTEDGIRLYRCTICFDQGWVYPLKDNGKPDYSRVVRCRCRPEIEKLQEMPEHQEKRGRRKK